MNLHKPKRLFVFAVILSLTGMVLLTGCGQVSANTSKTTVLQAGLAPDLFVNDAPPVLEQASPQASNQPTNQDSAEQAAPTQQSAQKTDAVADAPAQEQAAVQANEAAVGAAVTTVEPSVGSLAPDFTLMTLDGQPVSLSGLRGKNVLINYWVTWCIPCLKEMPALEKLYGEYQQEGLVVLSINGIAQDEMNKVMETVTELGLTYPVVLDENDAVYKSYWLGFMPTSLFVDEQGVIRFIKYGGATEEEFRTKIEQLLSDQL